MKKLYILCILALAASGCTKGKSIGCEIQDRLAGSVAQGVSSALQCSNAKAVLDDVIAQSAKWGICSLPSPTPTAAGTITTKSVGTDICNTVGMLLVGGLAQGAIPAKWGCSAENAQVLLKNAASDGCRKIFP